MGADDGTVGIGRDGQRFLEVWCGFTPPAFE